MEGIHPGFAMDVRRWADRRRGLSTPAVERFLTRALLSVPSALSRHVLVGIHPGRITVTGGNYLLAGVFPRAVELVRLTGHLSLRHGSSEAEFSTAPAYSLTRYSASDMAELCADELVWDVFTDTVLGLATAPQWARWPANGRERKFPVADVLRRG